MADKFVEADHDPATAQQLLTEAQNQSLDPSVVRTATAISGWYGPSSVLDIVFPPGP